MKIIQGNLIAQNNRFALVVSRFNEIVSQKLVDGAIDFLLRHNVKEEDIDIEKEGKDILIGFNPKFFIDALRVIDEEEVTLYMVNPKAPCFIKDENESFIYLILPVNFNSAAN